jgi:hypothetical protein
VDQPLFVQRVRRRSVALRSFSAFGLKPGPTKYIVAMNDESVVGVPLAEFNQRMQRQHDEVKLTVLAPVEGEHLLRTESSDVEVDDSPRLGGGAPPPPSLAGRPRLGGGGRSKLASASSLLLQAQQERRLHQSSPPTGDGRWHVSETSNVFLHE